MLTKDFFSKVSEAQIMFSQLLTECSPASVKGFENRPEKEQWHISMVHLISRKWIF